MAKANRLKLIENKLNKIDLETKKYNEKIDKLFSEKQSLLEEKEDIEKENLWKACKSSGLKMSDILSLVSVAREENNDKKK